MTHRSRLMKAVRECATLTELRAAVVEVACDLEESKRDTVPCPPPVYDHEREQAAPPTPLTLPPPPTLRSLTYGLQIAD